MLRESDIIKSKETTNSEQTIKSEIPEEKISINDITIDEIITCIRDIMGEYTCSSEKIGKIRNFVNSINAGVGADK